MLSGSVCTNKNNTCMIKQIGILVHSCPILVINHNYDCRPNWLHSVIPPLLIKISRFDSSRATAVWKSILVDYCLQRSSCNKHNVHVLCSWEKRFCKIAQRKADKETRTGKSFSLNCKEFNCYRKVLQFKVNTQISYLGSVSVSAYSRCWLHQILHCRRVVWE